MAIDLDTQLVPSWLVGTRDLDDAMAFIADLGSRLANRIQITTDGHKPYIEAIERAFRLGPVTREFRLVARTCSMPLE